MILKYSLFTIIMALIPYILFVDDFTTNILKPVKDFYLEVLLHITEGIDKLTPLGLNTIINTAPNFDESLIDAHSEVSIFTESSLKKFSGKENKQLYLSILGNVFDVTKGEKYYGVDGGYNIFAGRDASRAFVTGEFTGKGLTDDVIDLSFDDLRSLKNWLEFYHKEYEYKGKLVGRYFDEAGRPTLYNHKLASLMEQAELDDADKKQSKLMYPPCNVEWTAEEGSRVWCSKRSGGIDREWVGVPRKLYQPGAQTYRCACVNFLNPSKSTFATEQTLRSGNLEEYIGCHPEASSCYIAK